MLIGLTGDRRSGKDTVADYLVRKYDFEKYAFADPMKKALKILFAFDDDQLWGDKKEDIDKRWNVSPREVMQKFATDFIQFDLYKYFPEIEKKVPKRKFWCILFETWYKNKYHKNLFNVVISDMRFIHEADTVRDCNGRIWLITRKKEIIYNIDSHLSETELKQITPDIHIKNDGTIEELYKKIDNLMIDYGKRRI
ncbi:MAG: hypothetical protein ACFFG0_08130 [Candidatus Thorarchaeota archaeon]